MSINSQINLKRSGLINFFSEILPPQETGQCFIAATPHPKKSLFDKPPMKHIYAATHEDLADVILELSSKHKDTYYGLGRFLPHCTVNGNPGRMGNHVQLLKAFWIDIDVGKDKSTNGLGYSTKKEAIKAMFNFVSQCDLPLPTHLIDSGGGVHAYWVLTKAITPENWKPISLKLKELTTKFKFLADPARTADIASILRPPFTQNHKLNIPRDVILKQSKSLIHYLEFAKAVETAHALHCGPKQLRSSLATTTPSETPEEIEKVNSMLARIPANCSRDIWRNIIWAIADTGWVCAEELARRWSMTAPEVYIEEDFNQVWQSFDPTRADSIKYDALEHYARQYGWIGEIDNVEQPPEWVEKINQDYALIEKEAGIYRIKYTDFIDAANFKLQLDNKIVSVKLGNNTKHAGAGSAWLRHPKRRQHPQLVFKPNEALITHDNCLNEWQGFDAEPIMGDVEPFLNLLERLIPDEQLRIYVMSWMAHLLQRPSSKLHVSLVFWSHEQGVGKNLLFECLTSIIGKIHATIIGQGELADNFNGWTNRKILVIGDEISSTDRRQDSDKLKGLITGTSIYLNEKYQRAREVPNLLNFIFLSNHHDTLFINDHDRRFFIWEITAGRLPEREINKFVEWRDREGLSALLHFLLNYKISDFNPKAPALMTAAKQQMINDTRSDLECWISELISSGANQVLGREVVTAHEVAKSYALNTSNKQPSVKAVVGICKRFGAYARNNQIRLKNGKKIRVLALNRSKYWKQQPETEWINEINKPLKIFLTSSHHGTY